MSQPNIKFKTFAFNSAEDLEKKEELLFNVGDVLHSSGIIKSIDLFVREINMNITLKPRIFLLFDGNELVSAAWGHEGYVIHGKDFHISEFGTRAMLQRKRYGTRLVAETVNYLLLKEGYENVNLFSKEGTQIINRRIFEKSKRYNLKEKSLLNPDLKEQIISKRKIIKPKLK